MHLLIFLNLVNKFLETFHIDEVICTKLPNIEVDFTSELTRIVILVMFYSLYAKINSYFFYINNA